MRFAGVAGELLNMRNPPESADANIYGYNTLSMRSGAPQTCEAIGQQPLETFLQKGCRCKDTQHKLAHWLHHGCLPGILLPEVFMY